MEKRRGTDARSRVLVVEDDEETGVMLSSMLEDRGYAVKWAQQGEEGLRHCIAATKCGVAPHVVLLDLRLPDMEGTDLARSLSRALQGAPPIIVLSALPAQLVQQAARQIGARAALRKPFDVQRLLASIAAAVAPEAAIAAIEPKVYVSHELLAAIHALHTGLPEIGAIRGGITETTAWAAAHRVVTRAMDELGRRRIAALGFDVALAQAAFLAASDAQTAYDDARVLHAAAPLDFALTDSYCYSLLQFALALGRALAIARPPEGSA